MIAQLRKVATTAAETFWLLPLFIVACAVAAALGLIAIDRNGLISPSILAGPWLYNGGGTGARTLLGTIASSTIGVAGTVFSITIAALSLAAGQMGPRLLRNFVHDRGNQLTLGTFLGTFSYALIVLRSVRTDSEGTFTPHLSLTVAIVLALLCVATLVFFVGHMAARINVEVVIDLVSNDVEVALRRLTTLDPQPMPATDDVWPQSTPVTDHRRGYLQHIDEAGLADWAAAHGTSIRLLVRPGSYVFPGAPIALAKDAVVDAETAVRKATALGPQRVGAADIEYSVRHLVEVALRALSPGINDPHTAVDVLDRLGATLCDIAPRQLSHGIVTRNGLPALIIPSIGYDGLADCMLHEIRQSARGSATVLIRILEVLTSVVSCERDPARMQTLRRHAALALSDAEHSVKSPSDLEDVRVRWKAFDIMMSRGPLALIPSSRLPKPTAGP